MVVARCQWLLQCVMVVSSVSVVVAQCHGCCSVMVVAVSWLFHSQWLLHTKSCCYIYPCRAAYVSYGGLLMKLYGDANNLHGFQAEKNVYLLMKKIAF